MAGSDIPRQFPLGKTVAFLLEADRGMPPFRKVSNTTQRSLYQKYRKHLAIREWIFTEHPYGLPGISVLTVTPPSKGDRRIKQIQEMITDKLSRHKAYSPKFFLTADHTIVNDNLLLKPWFTAEGEVVIAEGGK